MLSRFILFLARRVHARLARCDAAPGLGRKTGHLLCTVPAVLIIVIAALMRPSLRGKLADLTPRT